MVYLFLIIAVLLFAMALKVSRAVHFVYVAAYEGKQAVQVIRNPELTDEQKELATRRASIQMFLSCWRITWRVVVALALSAAVLWLGSLSHTYSSIQLSHAVMNGWFIAASTIIFILAWRWLK